MNPSRSLPHQTYIANAPQNQQSLRPQSLTSSCSNIRSHVPNPHQCFPHTTLDHPRIHSIGDETSNSKGDNEIQKDGEDDPDGKKKNNSSQEDQTFKISCQMLRGIYTSIPINDPTYLTTDNSESHHLGGHQGRFQNTHALDLSLLVNLLSTKSFPLDFAQDSEGQLDLDYNTQRKQVIRQDNLPHQHNTTHIHSSSDSNDILPLIALTRISPNEPLSLIAPIALLEHFIELNPSLSLPLPDADGLYCAIEVTEGSMALDLTGFISTLTRNLIPLSLNTLYTSTFHTDILLVPLDSARVAFTLLSEAAQSLSIQHTNIINHSPSHVNNNDDHNNNPHSLRNRHNNDKNHNNNIVNGYDQKNDAYKDTHHPRVTNHPPQRQVVVVNPSMNISLSCFPLSWFDLLYRPLLTVLLNSTITKQIKACHRVDDLFKNIAQVSAANREYQHELILSHTQQLETQHLTPISNDLALLQGLLTLAAAPCIESYTSSCLFSVVISSHSVTLFADKYITAMFLLSSLPLIHSHCISLKYPQLALGGTKIYEQHQQLDQQRLLDVDTHHHQHTFLPSPSSSVPIVSTVTVHPQTWDIYQIFVGSSSGTTGTLVTPVSELLAKHEISLLYLSTHSTDILCCQTPSRGQTIEALAQRFVVHIEDD